MHISHRLLLNLFIITPFCYAAETSVAELNRRLMQFVDKSGTVQDYRNFDDEVTDKIAAGDIHLVSECRLDQSTCERRTACKVIDLDGNTIWQLMVDNDRIQNTPWQISWHDANGEHIALRHPNNDPYQGVYRVSFLSTKKKLGIIERAFLYDAREHHQKHHTGYPIVYNDDYTKYRRLPSELRIPAIFNLSSSSQLCMPIDDCVDTIGTTFTTIAALIRKLPCCQRQRRIPF